MSQSHFKISEENLKNFEALLRQDPSSRAFAPLAEAYRERGNLSQAEKLARSGIRKNPTYPGGLTLLARILIDLDKPFEAVGFLEKSIDLDPQNLLSFQLLGTCKLMLGETKEALKSFKMVLFLNPRHEKAKLAVEKLESVTADEFADDLFQFSSKSGFFMSDSKLDERLQKSLSLFDAMLARNNFEKAKNILDFLVTMFPINEEIKQRKKMLKKRSSLDEPAALQSMNGAKISKLRKFLAQIKNRSAELKRPLDNSL